MNISTQISKIEVSICKIKVIVFHLIHIKLNYYMVGTYKILFFELCLTITLLRLNRCINLHEI